MKKYFQPTIELHGPGLPCPPCIGLNFICLGGVPPPITIPSANDQACDNDAEDAYNNKKHGTFMSEINY